MEENRQEIAGRLKQLLEIKKIKQAGLAKIIESTPSYVSRLLNGKDPISISIVLKILNIYKDVNANWLLLGEGLALFQEDEQRKSVEFSGTNKFKDSEIHFMSSFKGDKESCKEYKKKIAELTEENTKLKDKVINLSDKLINKL